ncbi:hypothetical protein Tco_0760138 [Tanacetum coccineum]
MSQRVVLLLMTSLMSNWGSKGEVEIISSDDERTEFDKEKADSMKAYDKEMYEEEEEHIDNDEEKHNDDEVADEEETGDERTESKKDEQEMSDVEKIDAEKAEEEKDDEEQTKDDQTGKDDQADDDEAGALICVTHKEKPELPVSTSILSLSSDYGNQFLNISSDVSLQAPLLDVLVLVIPIMTTLTPSTTPPTTEVQATIVNATNPSPTVLLRLSELKRKVEALSKVNHSEVIKEFVQANVLNEVRNQIPNFLPKVVYEFVKPRLERTVRDVLKRNPFNLSQSFTTQADLLSELELKKILMDKIGDLDPNKVLKRKCDDDEDQDPLSDSANEKKKKTGKDAKPSKKSSTSKESSKAMDAEEPILDDARNFHPEWSKDPNVDVGPEQTWFNDLEKATKYPAKFDYLIGPTIDFLNFIKHRLKKDKITKGNLEGLVFKLLKGDRYPYDVSKPLPLQGPPVKVAYNKDVALGISYYGPKRQLFYISQINKTSRHEVYFTMKILSLVRVKVDKQFGYGHLEEILVRRVDQKEYMFKEGDFPRLHLNDIEDMLLLNVQNKLFHLKGNDIVYLVTALRMFTRSLVIKKRVEDVQLGVESYQKELNITKPQKEFAGISFKELYTTTYDPKGVLYINKSKRKRLISNTLSWKSYQGDSSKLNLPDYMSVLTELEVYSKAMYDDLKMFKITVYQACWNKLKIKAHYILKQDKVQRIKATSKTEDIHRMLNSFTEYELKNMLYDKMQQSRSFQEHYKHLDLYNALISLIGLDEAIAKGDIYPAKVLKKRRRDDKDEDPPAKSDKEKKMRKLKDYEPPKDDQAGSSKKVEEPVQEVAMDVEEPVDDEVVNVEEHPQDDASPKQDKSTWFKQPPRPETPNP